MLKIKKKKGTLRGHGVGDDTGTGGTRRGDTGGDTKGGHWGEGHEGTQGQGGDIGGTLGTPQVSPAGQAWGKGEGKFQEFFLPWEAPDPP